MNWRNALQSRFSQGVLWNLASIVVLGVGGILINLITVITRGEDALGVFNQVYSIFMLTSQIGIGGIHFSVLKQVSYHQDDRELCGDITTSGMILACGLLLITCIILGLFAGDIGRILDSQDVEQGIGFVLPGIFFVGLNRLLNNTINGLALMRVYAVSQASRFVITPLFVLILALSPLPMPYLLWSFSIAEFILFLVLVGYVYGRLIPLRLIRQARYRFREHLSYASRGFLSGVIGTLNTRIDIIMLGYFTSDQIVGIYSLASTLTEGFVRIAVAIRWNVDPVLGQHFARGSMDEIRKLISRMRKIVIPFMGLLALTSVLLYPFALALFVEATTVIRSWQVFSIIMVGVVINAHYRVFKGMLLQGDKPGTFTAYVSLTLVSSIALNILLIPPLGLIGAAIATMLTYTLESVIMVYFVKLRLGIFI